MSIEALRAKLREAQQRSENNSNNKKSGGGDNASFPFWNMKTGETSAIRFLPDGDMDNPFFWVERQVIKLPFDGVVGGEYPTNKEVQVTVPCLDMFDGRACPIIAATKHLWDEGKTDPAALQIARTYYKKRSYIFQGFVVNSPLDEEAPENPIRRFVINKSIYDLIYESLLQPNFESLPTDYEGGRDFSIKKSQKGDWANYGTSSWSYSTRSLDEAERAAIDKFGLFDLKEAKGAEPTAEGEAAIKAMFEDSFAGKPFDHDAYGSFYRPYSTGNYNSTPTPAATNKTVETASNMTSTPAVEKASDSAPADTGTTNTKESAQAIIDRLRSKSQA